jgi:beta-mannosidase
MLQNLHDGWHFSKAGSNQWHPAVVPGCVHTDLRRSGSIEDPFWGGNEQKLRWIEEEDWIYRTEFKAGTGLLEKRHLDLVADGLDTVAQVRLNGKLVARTESMFCGYRFPVRGLVKPGNNSLEIRFESLKPYIRSRQKQKDWREWMDVVGGCSLVRKEQCSFGWDWGPRFPTCGIYRPLKLEGWDDNRIESVRVTQEHRQGKVRIKLFPHLAQPVPKSPGAAFRCRLSLAGKPILLSDRLSFDVPEPKLWWPNGLGGQPLYELEVELWQDGGLQDTWRRRIGLRELQLDRHQDKWGESFQFKVNGLPFFAKGANWIPSHSFVSEATRPWLDGLLSSAVEGHMNMLRVWGGGIYESEDFYDLCDEKGLCIWQDFMFACTLYPGQKPFLKLVEQEAGYQVRRLSHRACLALWCGNNELEQEPANIIATRERKKAYDTIFYKILPEAVGRLDGTRTYWPCSPHNPEGYEKGHNNEKAGDAHFWDVWHARKPVKTYETKQFRFCSEFGMQSFSSPEIAKSFCPPEEFNIFSPAMENHQKNGGGNAIILDYISRLYRFPKDYPSLAYLSQLNQAYCMKTGIEHFRRSMPRTMGALYWQLNDCWPVFSWSSLEFGGKWKALHYWAKRFFAPTLVTAHVPGEEWLNPTNQVESSIHEVKMYGVHEGREAQAARLEWTLFHLDKRIVAQGGRKAGLKSGQVTLLQDLDFKGEIQKHGARSLALRLQLLGPKGTLSENTVLFTAPRYINFPKAQIQTQVQKTAKGTYHLVLKSPAYQHQAAFDLPGLSWRASDNYFDLWPGEAREVELKVDKDLSAGELKNRLKAWSLVDSYS